MPLSYYGSGYHGTGYHASLYYQVIQEAENVGDAHPSDGGNLTGYITEQLNKKKKKTELLRIDDVRSDVLRIMQALKQEPVKIQKQAQSFVNRTVKVKEQKFDVTKSLSQIESNLQLIEQISLLESLKKKLLTLIDIQFHEFILEDEEEDEFLLMIH